jgi:hypothetical protein
VVRVRVRAVNLCQLVGVVRRIVREVSTVLRIPCTSLCARGVRSLRNRHMVRTLLGALRDSNGPRFCVVHYSLQANHLHLIVEAEGKAHLSTGMRSLAVRLARRVNKLFTDRRGHH